MTSKTNKVRTALAIALSAAAGPVAALGLGQIQVKSRLDQPLLAEIPIISNDPAELEQLQARLASPETFRRIGLEPPSCREPPSHLRAVACLESPIRARNFTNRGSSRYAARY